MPWISSIRCTPSILFCPAVLRGPQTPWMASTGPLDAGVKTGEREAWRMGLEYAFSLLPPWVIAQAACLTAGYGPWQPAPYRSQQLLSPAPAGLPGPCHGPFGSARSFRFPDSLTIASQMCPLLESLQTLSVCSYWASKALGCCSGEGRMLYCTRRMLELLPLSWSSTRNVHSLPRSTDMTVLPLPGKGQVNKRGVQSEYWNSTETGSPRENGKLLPGKKEGFAVST